MGERKKLKKTFFYPNAKDASLGEMHSYFLLQIFPMYYLHWLGHVVNVLLADNYWYTGILHSKYSGTF